MSSRAAFTLVELLVVITLVVLLLALLTPAIDKAMDRAMLLNCQMRQRTLQTGMMMYAMDYKQWLPEWLTDNIGATFWWRRLHDNHYVRDREMLVWQNTVGPSHYASPFACPDRAPTPGISGCNTDYLPEWIALNIYLGWNSSNTGSYTAYKRLRLANARQPSATYIFTDGWRNTQNYPVATQNCTITGSHILCLEETLNGVSNITKHDGGANYTFIDGHNEFLTSQDAQTRSRQGYTGQRFPLSGITEYFVLPFPHPTLKP